MKNIIVSLLFLMLAFPVFTTHGAGQSLKQKCNEGYSACLKECTEKNKPTKDDKNKADKTKATLMCQAGCYAKKKDCEKSAANGKEYSWEAENK